MAKVWWKANTARGMWLRDTTGVECPGCGTKWVLLQTRSVVAGLLIFFGGIGCIVLGSEYAKMQLGRDLSETEVMFLVVPTLILAVIAQARIAPQFSRVRGLIEGDVVRFPLSKKPDLETELTEEDRLQLEQLSWSETLAQSNAKVELRPWVCLKCQETNPSGFEVCWKCEHERSKEAI